MSTQTSSASSRSRTLSRPLLNELYDWWLQGVPTAHDQPVGMETFKRWFTSDAELDGLCREKYASAVKEAEGLSPEEVGRIVQTPEEAVGAVLLLDQIPRNIFRGTEAAKVYELYDPKGVHLAKYYLVDKDYSRRDAFPHFARSMWLYMPLMHSENISDHDLFASLLEKRSAEVQTEAERAALDNISSFEGKHRAVLEKYGRYPSRNEALGRKSTAEEIELLKDGPGW
ncbi:uncharacterized protein MKK02DRAFT_38436 [Dioszegia hungarica]|uniref:DUF924-domain-containing protein n=1 Tax=Dioszegia hungarica TaxID=4972 RepID=A0AA38LR15_9TREE|nr:uncharacterized protein MKK02DRAFT_38436 [Dioszegia hungarica]KAI9633777.1 hypothetical protein MKK02DRAFT_38436 [Dioszegia hungarica]